MKFELITFILGWLCVALLCFCLVNNAHAVPVEWLYGKQANQFEIYLKQQQPKQTDITAKIKELDKKHPKKVNYPKNPIYAPLTEHAPSSVTVEHEEIKLSPIDNGVRQLQRQNGSIETVIEWVY